VTTHFDPLLALRVLLRHDVEFVVIGGMAGRVWGSPSVTNDLDVCYSKTEENLTRLSAALHELEATLRGVDDAVPFTPDVPTLSAGDAFTFTTNAGFLDAMATVDGTAGFDELRRTAEPVQLGDLVVPIASLLDLIRMKRAAGRPKDLIEIEVLGAVLEERDRRS
jgi:hypothetical protein